MITHSAGAIYNYPGKGHDRLFLDAERQFFAVIDGAGGAELSQAIVDQLPASISKHTPIRERSPQEFLTRVATDLDSLPEGRQRKATAAIACTAEFEGGQAVTFANFGDSSLWLFQPDLDAVQLAHDATNHVKRRGRTYIDTSEFLGARRSPRQISAKVGSVLLAQDQRWSIVGMSDGVFDDDGRGVSIPALGQMVDTLETEALPEQILDSLYPYDDASVFVIASH